MHIEKVANHFLENRKTQKHRNIVENTICFWLMELGTELNRRKDFKGKTKEKEKRIKIA